MSDDNPRIETMHADRLWGRGQSIRLATRAFCKRKGHDWRAWHYDWPEDEPGPPREDEPLTWLRSCQRDCGCVQVAKATLLEVHRVLPGVTKGWLYRPSGYTDFSKDGCEHGGTHLPD